MRVGDFIRLKLLLTPTTNSLKAYRFGQVVALVTVDSNPMVLAHLCDRPGTPFLTDDQGQPILHGFWSHEVEDWRDRPPA